MRCYHSRPYPGRGGGKKFMDQKETVQFLVLSPPNAMCCEDRHDEAQQDEQAVGYSQPGAHRNAGRASNGGDQHDGCAYEGSHDAIDEKEYEGELLDAAKINKNLQSNKQRS